MEQRDTRGSIAVEIHENVEEILRDVLLGLLIQHPFLAAPLGGLHLNPDAALGISVRRENVNPRAFRSVMEAT